VSFWDKLEEAGHEFTMVSPLLAGKTTYVCEKCGAVMVTTSDGIQLFHAPAPVKTTVEQCSHAALPISESESLKAKLRRLDEADYERLRQI
jgi:hypothetical protein